MDVMSGLRASTTACRSFARPLLVTLLVLLAPPGARASAAPIDEPPPELGEIVATLAEAADAIDRGDWQIAERDCRIARFAWSMAQLRPTIGGLPSRLTHRMDRIAPTLGRAIDARARARAGAAANLGGQLTLELLSRFRRRPERALLELRASVREVRVAAERSRWEEASAARHRALLTWRTLRRALDRPHASTRRTRPLVPDLDVCFEELSASVDARTGSRARRAARCALDLTAAARLPGRAP